MNVLPFHSKIWFWCAPVGLRAPSVHQKEDLKPIIILTPSMPYDSMIAGTQRLSASMSVALLSAKLINRGER